MKRDTMIAAVFSVFFHIFIFTILAAGGIFTYLYHREPTHVDVSVYDDDLLQMKISEEFRNDGGIPATGADGPIPGMEMTMGKSLPKIGESKTANVFAEQEIKSYETEKFSGRAESTISLAGTTATSFSDATKESGGNGGTDRRGSGNVGGDDVSSGSGSGQGDGQGNGKEGTGTGSGSGDSGEGGQAVRPARGAYLIFQPDTSAYYPQDLRKKGISGMVSLSVTISADGSVASAFVSSTSGYDAMDSAALQIAYACKYEPAVNEYGQYVSTRKTMNIPFSLQ